MQLFTPTSHDVAADRGIEGSVRSGDGRAAWLIDRDIRRLEASSGGPAQVGQPQRLASLRLTAQAGDYLRAGNDEAALDLLERAISIDGAVGFAYLYMAVAHHNLGDGSRAAGFLERATPLLPADRQLLQELDTLRADVYASTLVPIDRVY